MRRAAILSFSERGGALAERLVDGLRGEWQVELRAPRGDLAAATAMLFPTVDALIFVGACGIAVRAVAPLLAGKTRDPAVVVVDERGQHAISLLSGHIGGANALALRVAGITGGEAVITTATDVNGRFSVDAWAARRGLRISDMRLAKRFSAEILRRDLPLWSEFPIEGELPEGIFLAEWKDCTGDTALVNDCARSRMNAPENCEAEQVDEVCREDTAESSSGANSEQCGVSVRHMEVCASQRRSEPLSNLPSSGEAEQADEICREDTAESSSGANPEQCGARLRHMEVCANQRMGEPLSKGMRQAAEVRPGEIYKTNNGVLFADGRAKTQEVVPSGVEAEPVAGDCLRVEKDSVPRACAISEHCGDIGAAVTCRAVRPFGDTLRLVPPVLHLGVGCKRGASAERIAEAVRAALDAANLLPEAVAGAASIDVKRDEPGLRGFCAGMDIPIAFYSAEELRAQPGEFTASEFVERTVGVDNVCERAAMRAAGPGAKLLVPKRGANGVTVAIACADWRVRFP